MSPCIRLRSLVTHKACAREGRAGLASILVALSLGLGGCASESPEAADEAPAEGVSSALPVAAVSLAGANFANLGLGGFAPIGAAIGTNAGAIGGTSTIGTSAGIGGAPIGFTSTLGTGGSPTSFGTSFNSGPMGFSTGPITTGGSTSMSSTSGGMPVINTTCTGLGCP